VLHHGSTLFPSIVVVPIISKFHYCHVKNANNYLISDFFSQENVLVHHLPLGCRLYFQVSRAAILPIASA
jgi:hypothetical protein